MNRSVMGRQMFRNGGAAGLKPIPEGNMGLPNLPEGVRNNMGYMAMGGDPMMMPEAAQGIMATAPAMGAPSPEMLAQEGANMMDPNTVANMVEGASAAGYSDPEQAGSFEEMMNSVSGDNKSAEERRTDLASIVGPEDAGQTPESVLALVTPVVELALVDQGIGPMAQEQMNTPVEGDMGQGIMTMAANGNMGVGNEPPVNFNLGGEVRRRGDEDPVPVFMKGGPVQYMQAGGQPKNFADFNYQQKVGETAEALLPTFQKFMPTQSAEDRKNALQSDILFDIANTALAFSAPMQGEKEGMSAAERLAMATQQTKLLPTISARTAASRKEAAAADQASKTAALTGALGLETARLKNVAGLQQIASTKSYDLIKQSKDLAFKRAEGVSSRAHDQSMQNNKFGLQTKLDEVNKKLQSGYDITLEKEKGAIQEQLKKVQEAIDLNQMDITQEDELEKINVEYSRKGGLADINNIASMERKVADIKSNEKITDKDNATKQLISTEKNNTDKLINQNNIAQKNKRLEFDKVRESNLVAQRRAENQQAISELDLDKVTEARKTLEGLRKFELDKAAGERDQQKIALIERELNEVKIAETEIKKFSAESIAENRADVLKFKNKELKKLVEYRQQSNEIKSEMNQITRSNNVANQQLKDKEIALKKHKSQLEIFGTGVRGRVMNIMADPERYEAYAAGGADNVLEQAIADYASEQTDVRTGAKTQRELPPYMKEVLKKRLINGLSIPLPINKLGLSKAELKQYGPVSEEEGEASLNKIINPDVDLKQATGLMSTLKMGVRWAAGQASEFIPGGSQGDIFSTTSTGRKMLSALANATEGFLREAVSNDRLDKDTVTLIRQDIMRPSGGITDANAVAQLKQTRQTMKATVDRLNKMIDNPSNYSEKQVTSARGTVNLIEDLISNYSLAIGGYEKSFKQGSGAEANKVLKNIFNRRKVNN
tara:strand:+ start:141 stop:2984 length:2844 start_codon:yes stop_codon:yes gene_type:complete